MEESTESSGQTTDSSGQTTDSSAQSTQHDAVVKYDDTCHVITLDDRGSRCRHFPHFLDEQTADALFRHLTSDVSWAEVERVRGGTPIKLPRLQAWMAAEGTVVTTLYQKGPPTPWSASMKRVKASVESAAFAHRGADERVFDYALLNLYRDGEDWITFHRDDEADGIGRRGQPRDVVASLSLGCEREFVMRSRFLASQPKGQRRKQTRKFLLGHGSLFIMEGETQQHWVHGVPKDPKATGPRVNVTFRIV